MPLTIKSCINWNFLKVSIVSIDRILGSTAFDDRDGSNFAEIIRDCFAEGKTGPDRKCKSCLSRGNNSGEPRERQSDKKLSLAVEIMPWNRVRVPEVLLGCRVYDLSRRGCVSRVSLRLFLSRPATTRFHDISSRVLSRSANGV